MARAARFALSLLVLVACGDSDTNPSGGSGGGAASGGESSGAGNQGAGSEGGGASTGGNGAGGDGTGGEAPVVPTCVLSCASANDCATATVLTDVDNWSCDAGACRYQGCQSSLECQQAYVNANYVCETIAGLDIPTCVLSCNAATDCASPSPLTDADNWACASNRCVYQGCLSTTECTQAFGTGTYVCEQAAGATIPSCIATCGSAGDCATATALYDADNWSCEAERCRYLGCQSTAECQRTLANADYVCE